MERYLIDNEEVSREKFDKELEECIKEVCEDTYDEFLDEGTEPYKIGCCTFYASQVLKECDPIAYNCGLGDYENSFFEEANYELERFGEYTINGYTFTIEEVEEED